MSTNGYNSLIRHNSSMNTKWMKRLWEGRSLKREIKVAFFLALPLMVGELSSILTGVAGTMMAGRLGAAPLAASGVAGVVFVFSMLFVWGSIRMLPTPVAEAHELRDGEKVRTLVGASLLMGLLLTVFCSVLLWIGTSYFHLLRQDPEVTALSVQYLHIIVYSMPAVILFAVLVNLVDAFTFVRITMFISIGGLALDVGLNWLLIFGNAGWPAMGINAIALNTGITHAMMCLALGFVLWKHPELNYFRSASTSWKAIWDHTVHFIRQGIPSALQMVVEFSAFGAGTILIGQISKTEQAAHQIAINLISLTYVTIMGVSTAGMIRIGQALAYQNKARIVLAGLGTLFLGILIMSVPTIVFLFAPGSVVGWYMEDPTVVGIATTLVFMAGLFQLADAAQATSISLLRALNDIKIPALISFIAFWLIGLPLGYWLAMIQGWNAQGIWVGYLVALLIQATWFVYRFFQLLRTRSSF